MENNSEDLRIKFMALNEAGFNLGSRNTDETEQILAMADDDFMKTCNEMKGMRFRGKAFADLPLPELQQRVAEWQAVIKPRAVDPVSDGAENFSEAYLDVIDSKA